MCPHCVCSIAWMACQSVLHAGYGNWFTRKRAGVLVGATLLVLTR